MTLEELTERSTEEVARARAERIRQGLRDYLETVAEFALAWERHDWQVLGYADWQAYLDGEFGPLRLRVPKVHRDEAVETLRRVGMSTRAIGSALGIGKDTAARAIATVAGETDDLPDTVRSLDGRERPATRPAPVAAPIEPAATTETATGHLTSRPVDGADTATVDETPASPVVHPAGAAPAPAPPSATSPAVGGAGVTPCPTLSLAQIGRLRAIFEWARAGPVRHPRNAAGRGKPSTLGRGYTPGEPMPPVHPNVAKNGAVAHIEVCWEAGQVDVVYRSEKYVIDECLLYPANVDQALDLFCALGVLPACFSRQYAAGVQAGMRTGDAIDGEWTEP